MHLSIPSFVILAGAFVAAVPTTSNVFVARSDPGAQDAAVQIVQDLFYEITPYTANITYESLLYTNLPPTSDTNASASTAYQTSITAIQASVDSATASVKSLNIPAPATIPSKRSPRLSITDAADAAIISERQTTPAPAPTNPLAAELAMILQEIGTALNAVIATLGLTTTLSFLNPLLGSLSALLASLIPVVDNLLELVRGLVDGVLGGLSLALGGLVL